MINIISRYANHAYFSKSELKRYILCIVHYLYFKINIRVRKSDIKIRDFEILLNMLNIILSLRLRIKSLKIALESNSFATLH